MADNRILLIAALFLSSFLKTTEAGGTIEVRLVQYYNHHGHDSTFDHCDSFFGFFKTSKCDPFFKIKMNNKNKKGDREMFWSEVKTKVYKETDNVRFGSELSPSQHNPIKRHFVRWMPQFNIEVEVIDHDYMSAHDHMDTIKASMFIKPDNKYHRKTVGGTAHGLKSRLTFSVIVKCDEHYYGPSCTKRCVPRDDGYGHYECTENGEKKCLPTWHDAHIGCLRRDVCDPNPCRHGGKCTALYGENFQCACKPDYHGHRCEVRTKPCEAHNHCLHGGICVNDDLKNSHCKCPPQWKGHFCEVDKNECDTRENPCINGGTCVNTPGSYSCKCTAEFTGSRCEEDVDECMEPHSAALCFNNGTCSNLFGGYECLCPEGVNGTHCEILHSFKELLCQRIRRLGKDRVLMVLSSLLLVILFFATFLCWRRRWVAYHVRLLIKENHTNSYDDEPRLEFKKSFYDTLDETEVNREMKSSKVVGVSNKAYINHEDSPKAPQKFTPDATEKKDPSYTYTKIMEDNNQTRQSDLPANVVIDSGDGFVQLPDDMRMEKGKMEQEDEEKLKQVFEDPALFPPQPVSPQSPQKKTFTTHSAEDSVSVS